MEIKGLGSHHFNSNPALHGLDKERVITEHEAGKAAIRFSAFLLGMEKKKNTRTHQSKEPRHFSPSVKAAESEHIHCF